jgi:hypothetical protein
MIRVARHYIISDTHVECAHQILKRMLSARTDAHAQCMHQFLPRMISMF